MSSKKKKKCYLSYIMVRLLEYEKEKQNNLYNVNINGFSVDNKKIYVIRLCSPDLMIGGSSYRRPINSRKRNFGSTNRRRRFTKEMGGWIDV